jgi:hypothetical protein
VLLLVMAAAAAVGGCVIRAPDGRSAPSAPAPASSSEPDPSLPAPVPAAPAAAAVAVPARLGGTGAPERCLAQIEAFAELHSGNRVMLGKAAFADSSQLVLTRMPRQDKDGRRLDGREAAPQPVVLDLLSGPEGCSVRLAASAGSTAQAPGADLSRSAPLPACSCLPLER